MNIIRKENEYHLFCEVRVGEVFEHNNSIFMKFGGTCSDCHACNAICLNDGIIMSFADNEEIRPINADLVIH